jgi:hypothetical protein
MYKYIDRLLLLKDGYPVYQGPIANALPFFSSHGFTMREFCNPFDFFLDVVTENPTDVLYTNYQNLPTVNQQLASHEEYKYIEVTSFHKNLRQVHWCLEFILLLKRTVLNYLRNRTVFITRVTNCFMISLIIMGYYWRFADKTDTLFYNFIGFFFNNTNMLFVNGMYTTIYMIPAIKTLLKRECSAKLYRVTSFYLAFLLTLLINSLLYAVVFTTVLYFTNGLFYDPFHYLIYFVLNFFIFTFGQYVGFIFGTFVPHSVSIYIVPFFTVFFMLGSGFYKGNATMPVFISWLFDVSPYKYFIEILTKLFSDFNDITRRLPVDLDYQFGIVNCIYLLLGFLGGVVILGLIGMKMVTAKF